MARFPSTIRRTFRRIVTAIPLASLTVGSVICGAETCAGGLAHAHARPQNSNADQERVYSPDEVDVKAKVRKSLQRLPERRSDCLDPVRAKVRAVLHKSGKVTEVIVTEPSGCSYDREVIKVVKKLNCSPAMKDGRPVSQYSEIEYKTEAVRGPASALSSDRDPTTACSGLAQQRRSHGCCVGSSPLMPGVRPLLHMKPENY